MGTKVNTTGLRLGNNINWTSNWRSNKFDYANTIHQDLQIQQLIKKTLKNYGIIIGKIFIRKIKTENTCYIIQGSYYITVNSKHLVKKKKVLTIIYTKKILIKI
jgi:ribosomal protein S3